MTSSSGTPFPISGVQPSRVAPSVTWWPPVSEPPGDGSLHSVAEAAPRGERVVHGRGLVPTVHHAVAALLVAAAPAVVLPARGLQQLLEARGIAFLHQVAGALPAEDVVGGVAPRRALEVPLAHQKLQEQRRLVELPPALRVRQERGEEVVGALGAKEMLLVGRLRVAVARRDHHALDAQIHHGVEELAHPERVGAVEERRVRGHPEATTERLLDPLDRVDVDPVAAHRLVVLRAEPVQMDAEREVVGGLEEAGLELLLQEDGVRAEIDVLLARHQRLHQGSDLRVHQGLAAGDRHHRRVALVDRRQTLLDRQVLPENLCRILDLAAAGAREIATEQRLQHEHQGVSLSTSQLLTDDVGRDRPHLRQRHTHARRTPWFSGLSCVATDVWMRQIATAMPTWSAAPTPAMSHSPIHSVTPRLKPSTP